jgi:hypothetical protein
MAFTLTRMPTKLLLVWVALLGFETLPSIVFGEESGLEPAAKIVPQDQYEFEFLGVTLGQQNQAHEGLFLFIWKGNKPVKVFGSGFNRQKRFLPYPSFSVHWDTGWSDIGPYCGTGSEWTTFQPGQVVVCSMSMGWVERDLPGFHSLQGANRAVLKMDTSNGEIASDEFPLPLVPKNSK